MSKVSIVMYHYVRDLNHSRYPTDLLIRKDEMLTKELLELTEYHKYLDMRKKEAGGFDGL